jgi:integrase
MTPGQIINAMPAGTFTILCKVNPYGSLQARRDKHGAVTLYWRYSIGTKSERVTIGTYHSTASPKSLSPSQRGYSVAAAVHAAEAMAEAHRQNKANGGRPAQIAAQKAQAQAQATQIVQAAQYTLRSLLTDYTDHQQTLGRTSFKDAKGIFDNHVFQAFPAIADLPANEVSDEQFADMMRRLVELGKGRTANKLRTYAAAAYALAKSARTNPAVPVKFKAYGIRINPAADTSPDRASNRADKNPLTLAEMQTYWQAINDMKGFYGAALRLHLLTGGQRIEQFLRLLTADTNTDTIKLYDSKGRPGAGEREVVLPLLPAAAVALAELNPVGTYAISLTNGESHLWDTAFAKWSRRAGSGIADFTPKRLRSGVETLLAKLGVSMEIRGRLQSHGISGVQAKHYDGHDYLDEKRKALELLYNALISK